MIVWRHDLRPGVHLNYAANLSKGWGPPLWLVFGLALFTTCFWSLAYEIVRRWTVERLCKTDVDSYQNKAMKLLELAQVAHSRYLAVTCPPTHKRVTSSQSIDTTE